MLNTLLFISNDEILHYFTNSLISSVPQPLYEGLFSIAIIVFFLCVCTLKKDGIVISSRFWVVEYIFFIFCSTLLFRDGTGVKQYSIVPCHSYLEYIEGKDVLLLENMMNILVFVPIGLLSCVAFKTTKRWIIVSWSFCLSVSIEISQYVFMRGLAELDDVIHNTIGCLLGVGIYIMIKIKY